MVRGTWGTSDLRDKTTSISQHTEYGRCVCTAILSWVSCSCTLGTLSTEDPCVANSAADFPVVFAGKGFQLWSERHTFPPLVYTCKRSQPRRRSA